MGGLPSTKKVESASWGQRSTHPQPATLSLVWPGELVRVSMDTGDSQGARAQGFRIGQKWGGTAVGKSSLPW